LDKIDGISAVILAGGASRRMGRNKAFLPLGGSRLIDRVLGRLDLLFREVLLVAKDPDLYADLPCRTVTDILPGRIPLVGIHAGLRQARHEWVFVTGCDMPYLSAAVIRRLCRHRDEGQAVIPHGPSGLEPLHALYSRQCLPVLEDYLAAGEGSVLGLLDRIPTRVVPWEEFRDLDPEGASLRNINTPQEYQLLRDKPNAIPIEGE